jgi:DNA modification methylase
MRGDALSKLRTLDDATIDSIVTDPPYELGFMGKAWDGSGIAYNIELWRECLRVLKPGGHLLAFGGTRTYHRMAVAIEDAGFEIRDSIHWVYGSGFPKSLDVSKAIDKAVGVEREVVGKHPNPGGTAPRMSMGDGWQPSPDITAPATDAAKQWAGWGTALKPAHEPIVVARKPLAGTVAANVLEHGTGAINIDGCRVGHEVRHNPSCISTGDTAAPVMKAGRETTGRETIGRWPANIIFDEAAGAELDAQSGVSKSTPGKTRGGGRSGGILGKPVERADKDIPFGHNDEGGASRFFYCPKPGKRERNAGLGEMPERHAPKGNNEGRNLGNKKNHLGGLQGGKAQNFHPTVKPLALMRYLVRLVTPPGGIVLDPFLGSGTTAAAAILEGFDWRGCEMTAEYYPIITGRVKNAIAEKKRADAKSAAARAASKRKRKGKNG